MGRNTKIDWCDSSWNPVTGCYHDCPYCYARGIAKRFGKHLTEWKCRNIHDLEEPIRKKTMPGKIGAITPYPHDFEPTLHRYKLDEPQKWKQPRNIFVCSMADLFGDWVPLKWIQEVFSACGKAPQHRYIFLTKNPDRYSNLYTEGVLPAGDGFWYGTTTTEPGQTFFRVRKPKDNLHTFISIEPIQEPFGEIGSFPEWVIIGAETGNRKGKITPRKEWIDEIAQQARAWNTPVFMKESLRAIMGEDFRQEFPWHTGGGCNGDYCEL